MDTVCSTNLTKIPCVLHRSSKYSEDLFSGSRTDIGQLPRVSTEDRVVSVFEPCVCLFHGVIKFSNFSLFHPSLFIQYSTEECSTVQLFIYKIIAVMIDIDPS